MERKHARRDAQYDAGDACFGVKYVYVHRRLDDVDTEVNDAIDTARSRTPRRRSGVHASWGWKRKKRRASRYARTGKRRDRRKALV